MEDKIILIVGGSGGIGSTCAKIFGRVGAKVILAARNTEKADPVAKEINENGGDAYVIRVEATELASVSNMVRNIIDDMGRIDVLINAFGSAILQPLLDIKPDDAKELIETNVYGTFLVTQRWYGIWRRRSRDRSSCFPAPWENM